MRMFLLALALTSTQAVAQQPFTLTPKAAVSHDLRYVVADTASTRFPVGEEAGPALVAGESVDVLLEEDGRVRFKKGEAYGWVPVAALTKDPPAAEPGALISPPSLLPE